MRYSILAIVPVIVLSAGCRNSTERDVQAGSAVTSQVHRGARVFADNCASCHGDAGQGARGPRLVGPGAFPLHPRPEQHLRQQPFRTAADVAHFVTRNMPPDAEARREMSQDEYWAVLAFALDANGVELEEPLGPRTAGSIVLNR